MTDFKLTYATMFNPPDELHSRFDAALELVKDSLGQEYAMLIDNRDVLAEEKMEDRSPIDTGYVLAVMQNGGAQHARQALEAARRAFPTWSRMPWRERVRLLRKAVALIEERLFRLSAAMALEVGKNRMESLGDVQETADLIAYSCDQMEANDGYIKEMGRDPLVGYESRNTSVLRPYGVWLVVSPFNFPFALTGGPVGAALVAGNTVVIKPASDTAWIVRLLVEIFRDAGLPDGVVNFVTGPGRTLGSALVNCRDVDGITFTGSFDVGMGIFRDFSDCSWVRPIILELGGKNAAIVSRQADLERAALGIVRSAFGLQGQKCSAASRVFIETQVYDEMLSRLLDLTGKLAIGDPTDRKTYFGPVINQAAQKDFKTYCADLAIAGNIQTGGRILSGGSFDKGFFVTPTLVSDVPQEHPLWQREMFLPVTMVAKVENLEEAMRRANAVNYGLTAGFYGSEAEAD
ncbi:MAG: aldehyde dehydrogenase family protein, partial [Chloroflexi bacterium]|nr:aldehyde dehydrogenase family protein [Chloroflexota bacterium]